MATQMQSSEDPTNRTSKRSRLMVDISPELRRRIKVAAAQSDLSMRHYVERILEQAVPQEASVTPERRHLTPEAVQELLQVREEIMRAHPGQVFEDSAETLRQIREERSRHLAELSAISDVPGKT